MSMPNITTPVKIDPDMLLDQRKVAMILDTTTKFLEARRVRGGGPVFVKIGSLVRYRGGDLLAWIAEQRRSSTSESPKESAKVSI